MLLECLGSLVHGDGFLPASLSKADRDACGVHLPNPSPTAGAVISFAWLSGPMSPVGCTQAARKRYEAILSKEHLNAEARLRLAGVRVQALLSTESGKRETAMLGSLLDAHPDAPIRFLASLFLGRVAEQHKDLAQARARFEEAHDVNRDWPSARSALASVLLQQGQAESARALWPTEARPDSSDPWYGYSCRILTPPVLAELRDREARQRPR